MHAAKVAGLVSIIALMGCNLVGCNSEKQLIGAQETGAIQRIKTVQQAETQYYSQFGKYAVTLQQLQDLVPPELAAGKSNGYMFVLTDRPNGFAVTAAPQVGRGRSFYSDDTLAIRADDTGKLADASSPEIK